MTDIQVLNPENPFILVHSPLISNFDLSKIVEIHKKRRETDKNIIMTMSVGRGGRSVNYPPTEVCLWTQRIRRHPESALFLVHPPSSRLLHYSSHPLSPAQHHHTLPASLFLDPYPADIDTYEIWSGTPASSSSTSGGYRDLGVDICEADVPALCTENFDYRDLRRHFVNGVLTSELLGKNIAVHVVGSEGDDEGKGDARSGEGGRYVQSVRDTRTFGETTWVILDRVELTTGGMSCEDGHSHLSRT